MPQAESSIEDRSKASSRNWPLHCARASLVAPFAAIMVQMLTTQLLAKQDDAQATTAYFVSSTVAALLIVTGFVASVVGFWGARRQRSIDTQIIACLGMFISGGLLVLTIWSIALRVS